MIIVYNSGEYCTLRFGYILYVQHSISLLAVPDLDKERPLPIPHLHDWKKMEVCLINFNKGNDDEGVYTILQYFEMECNCVRKITEGLFRKYSML